MTRWDLVKRFKVLVSSPILSILCMLSLFLVVVPLSVLSNWITEMNRFCPTLRAVRFHGPREERTRIKSEELGDLQDFDVVVTTYEVLVSEANWLRRGGVTSIVDEGHRLEMRRVSSVRSFGGMPVSMQSYFIRDAIAEQFENCGPFFTFLLRMFSTAQLLECSMKASMLLKMSLTIALYASRASS